MTETDDTANLVEQLRALAHGTLIDPDPQDVADAAADVIEAQGARIAELEDERDAFQEQQNNLAALIPDEYDGDEYQGALIERFVRDAAGYFEQQVAERDTLAVRIRQVEETSENHYRNAMVWKEQRNALVAQIQKALDYMADTSKGDWLISYHEAVQQVRAILAAAPSGILADVKADLIHEAAEAIRAHATAPTELIHPHVQIDPLIAWVADWMENPPEWVKVSYRKTSRKQRADER